MAHELLARLSGHARQRPDAEAVRQLGADGRAERRLTFAQLAAAVRAATAGLIERYPPGAAVILQGGNHLDTFITYLAGLGAGLALFPQNSGVTEVELCRAIDESGAVDVLRPAEGALALPADPTVREPLWRGEPALLLQSSGTTGKPKVVRRAGAALDAGALNDVRAARETSADVVLATVPLCHAYAIEHHIMGPLWAGARVHLCRSFDRNLVVAELERGEVTVFPAVPFMFEVLAQAGGAQKPLPHLRLAFASGAFLPRAVSDAFQARFGVTLGQLYGASEFASAIFNHPADQPFDPPCIGRPVESVEVRILDVDSPRVEQPVPVGVEGHMAVRSPAMLCGYLGVEPAPIQGGFFLTGDLGRYDEHGRIWMTGRVKLLIDIGAQKVNPLEVEAVLADYPGVAECVVVPVSVSPTLRRIKALLTIRPGAADLDLDDLRRFARARLSSFKVPRLFEVRAQLPKSAAGKIQRQVLIAEAGGADT